MVSRLYLDKEGARPRFDFAGRDEPAELGTMPLLPYIAGKRPPDAQDNDDYQTLFAREGAVAAPTAGLHFTPELVEALKGQGVSFHG